MPIFGNMVLEKNEDGTFTLSKTAIVWNFSIEQLEAEINILQTKLSEKQELLIQVQNLIDN
jgi:hypothetical protein